MNPRIWPILLIVLVVGFAYAEDGAATLPPTPAMIPLPPSHVTSPEDDGDELLLRRLDQLIDQRDRRIATLPTTIDRQAGRTPHLDARDLAAQEALTQHAAARAELRKALEEAASRAGQGSEDVLDRGRLRGQAAQLGPLSSANELAVAECYKDLAGSPDGTATDNDAGLKALQRIDPTQLSDAERPRHLYLTLWFILDGIRKLPKDAPATDRANRLKAARDTRTELANQFPTSALSQTAEALFAGLDANP